MNIFDSDKGFVHVSQTIYLCKDLTLDELSGMGAVFINEYDAGTGWIHRVMASSIGGKKLNFALAFNNDILKRVSFAFETKAPDLKSRHLEHNQFLAAEIGTPTTQTDFSTVYRFPWGEIASEMDPRSDTCNIVVSWS